MNFLKFAHIDYSLSTRSLDIFNIGCDGFCTNCCNPEIKNWSLNGISTEEVLKKVTELNLKFGNLIDKIILVGGDPIDALKHYPEEYSYFIKRIRDINKPVFLFTRYLFEEVPIFIKENCDYIKCGAYIPSLVCDNNIQYGIKLATSNQKIYKKDVDY